MTNYDAFCLLPEYDRGGFWRFDVMHFSAIVVQCARNRLTACVRELDALPGVEVHHSDALSGRIIAVQESDTLQEQKEGFEHIQSLPSVLMAQLVCHYRETEARGPSFQNR